MAKLSDVRYVARCDLCLAEHAQKAVDDTREEFRAFVVASSELGWKLYARRGAVPYFLCPDCSRACGPAVAQRLVERHRKMAPTAQPLELL